MRTETYTFILIAFLMLPSYCADETTRGFYPDGIRAEFYDDPSYFVPPRGVTFPGPSFTHFIFSRRDKCIDFVWGAEPSPVPNLGPQYWSVRWKGTVVVERDGEYIFSLEQLDDAARLFVDGKLVLDAWLIQPPSTHLSQPLKLAAGEHELMVEYHQGPMDGSIRLCWRTPTGRKELVKFAKGIRAEYYEDPDHQNFVLYEPPPGPTFAKKVLERIENNRVIDYCWAPRPHPRIDKTDWSVRWTGWLLVPRDDRYTFYFDMLDDAARLFIDGDLIIYAWTPGDVRSVQSKPIPLRTGLHWIEVHYHQIWTPRASIRLCWSALSFPKEIIRSVKDVR